MASTGNLYENAKAERFVRTLKSEEVYLTSYQTYHEARAHIGPLIEEVYNTKRLRSALGYVPPSEFADCPVAGVHHRISPAHLARGILSIGYAGSTLKLFQYAPGFWARCCFPRAPSHSSAHLLIKDASGPRRQVDDPCVDPHVGTR